jgi:phosphoribosyl 1,2-cyclic phosphodiesterase
MSLFISSLNSGSNGNCYYVGNSEEGVLVDAGISCREVEKRMKRLELSVRKIKAIFVSHEHSDHISGIPVLANKYKLPVYITTDTLLASNLQQFQKNIQEKTFRAYEPVHIGKLSVTAFPKLHDASEPHSFIVEHKGIKVGIFTDIGSACSHVINHFSQCHAAFLEANYDEEMLENGHYPVYLKRRIRSGWGHLSNKQALQLFTDHKPSFMTHLFLSHLSKNNNCPSIVGKLFNQHSGNTRIIIASRYQETPVHCIGNESRIPVSQKGSVTHQLSLF